jgi:hypothetical protein
MYIVAVAISAGRTVKPFAAFRVTDDFEIFPIARRVGSFSG